MKLFLRAAVFLAMSLPVRADTALVAGVVDEMSNRSYGAPHQVSSAFGPLQRTGFGLIGAIDPDAGDLREMLSALAGSDDEGRIVVLLAGRFVHSPSQTWFLGQDAGPVDAGSVIGSGVPIDAIFDLVRDHPGEVVMLLGTEAQGIALGPGLADGLGPLSPPENITFATGHPAAAARLVASELLVEGRALRGAFFRVPGLNVVQMDEPLRPFQPRGNPDPVIAPEDQSYWQAMSTLNNAFSYRAYLNRFPNGYYVPEALRRLALLETAEPEPTPQEVEQGLGLNRNQRRAIQRDLAVLGHYNRGIDGLFGGGTRAGIRAWQGQAGLEQTGYLDAAQVAQLSTQAEARRAQIRAEDRAYWQQTGQGNDEAGLRAYLARYPNGEFSELARQRLTRIEDRAYWQQTGQGQNEAGLRAYLERYPEGEFAQLATQRLAAIEAQREADDRAYWQATGAGTDEAGLRAYLARYPQGIYADQARQRLAEIDQVAAEAQAWQQALSLNTVEGYRAYLEDFPNGPNARAAREQIEILEPADPALGEMNQAELRLAATALQNLGILPRRALSELEIIQGLREFQRRNGLPRTGILDTQTLTFLTLRGLIQQ